MAKLAIATVVLVALFLAIAEVSCFRTIVTTTIEEVEQQLGKGDQGQSQQDRRCRQQVQQRYQQLRSCRNYLEPNGGSPFGLEMVVSREEQQQQQKCCQQLKQLGDCSCQAIQQIVEEEVKRFQQGQGQEGQQEQEGRWPGGRGRGQGQGQQQQKLQQILHRARQLPQECGLRQQCDIETPSYYYY